MAAPTTPTTPAFDFSSTNFLNELLRFFEQNSVIGMEALRPYALELACVLAIIDFCTIWAMYDGEMRLSLVISRVMKVGGFILLIVLWNDIQYAILKSFQMAGFTAANVSTMSDEIFKPSGILDKGFTVCGKLIEELHEISFIDDGGIGKCLMYLIAIVITLGAFFFIALQVLVTKIEFCVFATLGVILLPFGALRFTAFLFQRIMSGVFAFGIKLMVMFFLLGLFESLAGSIAEIAENSDFSTMLKISMSYATLAFLVWKLPNVAASMMNGQPSLEAGDIARGGGAAKGAAVAAGSAVGGAAGAVAAGAGKAASGYGFMNATIKASRASASQNGTSTAGEFTKNIARQSFSSSAIGKGLLRGANKAMNNMEDYKNIKSGDYATKPQRNRNNHD